jgi:hypothetical protein
MIRLNVMENSKTTPHELGATEKSRDALWNRSIQASERVNSQFSCCIMPWFDALKPARRLLLLVPNST